MTHTFNAKTTCNALCLQVLQAPGTAHHK